MLWLRGFSTCTSLPAWQAQMVNSACQWSGVTIETASSVLSSSTRRKSWTHSGVLPASFFTAAIREANSRLSGSTSQAISTSRISP